MKKINRYSWIFIVMVGFISACTPKVVSLEFATDAQKADKEYVLKAIYQNPLEFRFADEVIQDNDEVAKVAVKANPFNFEYLSKRLRNNRKLATSAVLFNSSRELFPYVGEALKNNESFLKYILERKNHLYQFIPTEQLKNKSLLKIVVKKYPYMLRYADESLRKDKIFILSLIDENPQVCKNLDKQLYADKEIMRKAIEIDAHHFTKMTKVLKSDEELIHLAMKKDIGLFRYVDKSFQENKSNREFILDAVVKECTLYRYLNDDFKKDEDFNIKLFKRNKECARDIFHYHKDRKMVKKLLSVKGESKRLTKTPYYYIDKRFKKDKELLLIALKNYNAFLSDIDNALKKDKEVVYALIKSSGSSLKYVDKKFQNDKELVLLAVKGRGSVLKDVSTKFKNDADIVMTALQKYPTALKYAGEKFKQNKKLVLNAIQRQPLFFYELNEPIRSDRDVALLALEKKQHIFKHLPKKLQDNKKFVKDALAKHPLLLATIKQEFKYDKTLILEAVKRNSKALSYVPLSLKNDKEILEAAKSSLKEGEKLWIGFNNQYASSDYNFKPNIDYMEFRSFLFDSKEKKQLSKKYQLGLMIYRKSLANYSKETITKFQRLSYIDNNETNIHTREDMNVFWIKRYVYNTNAFVIDNHKNMFVLNRKKDILELMNGIDTEAELSLYLWMYDSFDIRGEYFYRKTPEGYVVKKIEFGYPQGDTIPKRTYLLNISTAGVMTTKLLSTEIIVHPLGLVTPDPSFNVPKDMVKWIFENRYFIDPWDEGQEE